MGYSTKRRTRLCCFVGLSLMGLGGISRAYAAEAQKFQPQLAGMTISDFDLELLPSSEDLTTPRLVGPLPAVGDPVEPSSDDLEPVAIVRPTVESEEAAARRAAKQKRREEKAAREKWAEDEFERRQVALGYAPARQRGWSKVLARESIAYTAVRTVDMLQTMSCMDKSNCHEGGVLGRHPSKLKIAAFFAATTFGRYLLVKQISKADRDVAKIIAFGSLAFNGVIVGLNFRQLSRARD